MVLGLEALPFIGSGWAFHLGSLASSPGHTFVILFWRWHFLLSMCQSVNINIEPDKAQLLSLPGSKNSEPAGPWGSLHLLRSQRPQPWLRSRLRAQVDIPEKHRKGPSKD